MKIFLRTILFLIVLVLAGTIAFIYSGIYDIAAAHPHHPVTRWLIETMVDHAVESHAELVQVPADFAAADLAEGAEHYDQMCSPCHGAPGRKPAEAVEGMYPKPPELARMEDEEWATAELFWIVKNGLKMSGMPAFGSTHSDEKLWAITAVVRKLPEMSEDEYRRLSGSEETTALPGEEAAPEGGTPDETDHHH